MNQDTDTQLPRTAAGATSLKARQDDNNSWIKWLLGALAVAALVIIAFVALGGDADIDFDSGDVDVELPAVDVDIDAPDVDVDLPAVDVDGGDIDIEDGDAEADATGADE